MRPRNTNNPAYNRQAPGTRPRGVSLFDTHAHLNDPRFDEDRAAVLQRCRDMGISRIMEIADSPEDWDKAIALSRSHPSRIWCSLGLHPYYANLWEPSLASRLVEKAIASAPQVRAIGEIGLDYVKSPAPAQEQQKIFRHMLATATKCRLPVVIHCRQAYPDLLGILGEFYAGERQTRPCRGVLHCFSAEAGEAQAAVALGFILGVDGPITYPKNSGLRDAIRASGIENIVLETDSPYLPPQTARGQRNEPSALWEIAAEVARIFEVSTEEVARQTTLNADSLYGIAA